jgi:hypothetical protein
MIAWLKELDRVLRGDATQSQDLTDGRLSVSGRRLAAVSVLLAAFYGLCMGLFAIINRDEPQWQQPIASMVKVPALFISTLIVTFPSLYVFNALVGSRLTPITLARLMAATLGLTTAVLASFGTIIAFFSLTTASYSFILLLNVLIFAVAGCLGMGFLYRTLSRLVKAIRRSMIAAQTTTEGEVEVVEITPQRATSGDSVRSVFSIWIVVFALVGMQMSWILRPFVGRPDAEFTWFRPRSSSFFEAIIHHLQKLFGS